MNQEPAAISNEVLQGKDSLLYLVAENTSDVLWVMNIDGTCNYVSPSINTFTGHTVEEFVSMHLEEYLAPDSLEKIRTLLLEELTRKRMPGAEASTHTIDLEFLCRDGSRKWGEVRVRPLRDKMGRLCKIVGVTREETGRFLADQEREAMLELHRLAGERADLRSLMQGVTDYLKNWSGCDAIGIRLRDGDDFPYYETLGFPLSFVMEENRLCAADEKGEILRDSTGNPVIECMCGNILCGRFDPSKPFFTPRGSFWTNSTTELLASTTEADRLTRTRNRCNTQGYESLALVPLRCQGEIFGLLQFNDRRIGRFTKEKIALLERLADTLAAALAQRKTREAIEESEMRFHTLFNGMTSGVAIYQTVDDGADFKFIDMNEAGLRICATTKDKLFGRTVSEIFPAVRLTGIFDAFRKAWQTGEPQYCPVTRYDDGRIGCWVENRVYRLPNGEIVTVFDDVTRREEAEEQFRSSEDKFHKVFMATPDLVAITTMEDGLYLEINDSFCRVMGFEREETIGKTSIELGLWIDPDDRRQAVAELLKTGHIQNREVLMRTKSGETRFFLISGEEIQLFGKRCLITIAKDLTDRKRVEESLSKSENRYRRLFEDAVLGIFQATNEGKLITVNPAYAYMFGYDSVEDLMTNVRDIATLYADPSRSSNVVAMILERNGVVQIENLYRRRDGSVFTGMLHAWALRDKKERIVILEGYVEDISARKAAEDTLKDQNRFLQTLIDTIPIPVFFKDLEGIYRGCNRACEVLWGPREQMIGKTVYDVSPRELADVYFKADLEMFNNPGIQIYEALVSDRTGETRNVIFNKATYMDGNGHVAGLIGAIIDITERKQAEATLRESEQRYRSLFESSTDGILMTIPDGQVVDANPAACAMFGMTREEIRRAGREGLVEHDARLSYAVQQRELKGRFSCELTYLRKNGTTFPGETTSVRLLDNAGEPRSFVIIRDITMPKLAMEALSDSENLFRTLSEKSMASIYVVQDGVFRFVNPNAVAYAGYESVEMIGMPAESLIHPEDRMQARENTRKILRGELDGPCEFRIVTKQGDTRWLLETVSPIIYEGKRAILGNSMDITVHKLTAEALRLGEEKYRRIVDTASEGIWAMDERRVTNFVNTRMAEMLGYTPEEMIGLPVEAFLFEEDLGNHETRMKTRSRGKDSHYEHRFRRKDSGTLWTIVSATALKDEKGRFAGSFAMFTDITKRKRAEEALLDSKAQLNLALRSAGMGTWYWDVAANRRHFDGQVCRLLGLNAATFTGTAEEFFGTVHRDDREKLRTAMNRTLEQDLLYEPEYRVVWSDGSIHHIAARGRLVRDGEDRPVRINGIIWDITNSKKLEEELRESDSRFRNLVESAPDGIFVQTKGLIRYLNKAVLCILGAESQDQLIGQPFIDRIHPEFREGVKARARIITEEKERVPVQDQVYLRLDGTPVDVAVSVVPIHYDGEAGALVFLHDITERKKARRALAKSEEQYRHLFENALEGMFRSTVEGRYVQVNPALAKIFGYGSPEEMIEQVTDIGRQLYVGPNERARCLRILEEQDALRRFEVQMRRRDEACIWTVINSRVVRDDAGKALYIEGMISDITELKRAEEALRESERRLRQAQKMEAIGTLAGGIAHDFNNILAAVIGYTEMSLCNNMTKKQIVANLQQVLTAGLRAKDLIKQILTFSRQSEHEHTPVRIDSMIKEAVKMLRASLPVTIRIRQNIRVDMGAILADPTQIHQVVMNLATNAAHAMRAEGGVLGIELAEVMLGERDAEVIHADLHAGQYIRLTVSDTGHGIDSAILHRIFDPFFTTKEQGEGTGMGLAVVHGIVKNHDGVITVESEPGQGTTFEIYFPMIQSEAVTAEALQVGLPSGKGRGRLLFVDDEEALALLGMQLLTRIGYKVVTFTNSIDALEAFTADPQGFDAVITDQTMPRLTGLDLAKQMLQIRPDIPIILCTGFSEAVTPEKAKSIGIREFLMKPLVMRQMADVISGIFKEQG